MTEGETAFYKRRIQEELRKANAPENQHLRKLHLRWVLLYQARLDAIPKAATQMLEAQLREAGFVCEQMAQLQEQATHPTRPLSICRPSAQEERMRNKILDPTQGGGGSSRVWIVPVAAALISRSEADRNARSIPKSV